MKIAIAAQDDQVSAHFGHCQGFFTFDVEDSQVVSRGFLENPGHRPGFLPRYLHDHNVDVIIAGGMGAAAQQLFTDASIRVIVGAKGSIDGAIKEYLAGKLVSTDAICQEHEHHSECGQ